MALGYLRKHVERICRMPGSENSTLQRELRKWGVWKMYSITHTHDRRRYLWGDAYMLFTPRKRQNLRLW